MQGRLLLLLLVVAATAVAAVSVEDLRHRHDSQRHHHQGGAGSHHGAAAVGERHHEQSRHRHAQHAGHHGSGGEREERFAQRVHSQSTTKSKAKFWGSKNPRYNHQHMGYIPPEEVVQRDVKLKESAYDKELHMPGPADYQELSRAGAAIKNARVWHEAMPPRPVGYVNPPSCKTFPFCWQVPSPPAMKPAYWETPSSSTGENGDDGSSSTGAATGRPEPLAYVSPLGDVIDTHGPKVPTVLSEQSGREDEGDSARPRSTSDARKDLYEHLSRIAGDTLNR